MRRPATRRPARRPPPIGGSEGGSASGDGETGGVNDDSPLTAGAFGERLHPEDRPKLAAAYRRLAGAGVPLALEVRIVRTDGQPGWIRVDGEVSERREGAPTRLSGHVRDVTELKRLRSANAFLAGLGVPLARLDDYDDTLQRIATDAVPFLADRCIIEFVTESGSLVRAADSSYPPLVPVRLPPANPLDRVPAAPLVDRIVRSGQPLVLTDIGEAEVRALSATEKQRVELERFKPCDYIGTPLEIDGRCFGVFAILTRRDGRRFADQELELVERVADRVASALENARLYATLRDADERKTHFLAILSHELRNPLAAIVAGVDAIRDSVVRPAERATLEMIDRQSTGLARLLDDLLDVARVDADKVELELEWVSVTRALDDALAAVGGVVGQRRQCLSVDAPAPDVTVRADRVRLEQMLVNLLGNASRYTPEGGSIDIGARQEGESIVVDVSDTGVGLSEDERVRIFERFEQVHDVVAPTAGLGLGLSLVRALAELHGGSIDVDSAGKGQGSRFRLTLPHVGSGDALLGAEPAAGTQRPIDVLVIDDNRDAAESIRRVLERLGHAVDLAETGEGGAAAYRSGPADLVLLDIGLPDVDGYAVAERVRAHERERGLVPCHLVAVTGYGQARDRERALASGFDEHLVKPVRLAGLRALVAAAAERAETADAP